ncbi:MAG: dihydroorotate dehydrogenase [Bacteroidales bacterium]|nr:dihydroorotate dehydrogenase [Bacteroidales bacterium]
MVDLSVNLGDIRLDNPVIPASGTCGFGLELAEWYDINMLGAISLKGTTRDPRFGNALPRIAECPSGLINSVGLENPGIDKLLSEKIPALRAIYHKPIIANISGFSVEDFAFCAEKAESCPDIDILEVNISCPNVHGGGMALGTDPEVAAAVTRAVKQVSSKPVFVKLTPNVTDIVTIARACEAAGADGLTVINTLLGMRIDIRTRKPVVAAGTGGFSGPAIFPIAVRAVYQVAHACRIPVMGCGGISTAEEVIEMLMAGAAAVQVGSASLVNPLACKEIIEQLPVVMERLGLKDLKQLKLN